MTRLAGYTADGDALSDADVLSDDELAEDYARLRAGHGGRHAFKAPPLRPAWVDEYGYDRDGNYHPEHDGQDGGGR